MSMSEQRLSCIVCPMSCEGKVILESGQIKEIVGFTCQRGINYARTEVTAPQRMLTTTVRITGGTLPLLPVISKTALPKDKIISCARCLSTVTVAAPVQEGEVIYPNVLNLGVDMVATRAIAAQVK
jgi:CxxC motif-containing protein